MTAQQRKILLTVFTLICIVGGSGFIYVGYQLFQKRISIFYIFSAYIFILTGIVIFFGFRLTDSIFPKINGKGPNPNDS